MINLIKRLSIFILFFIANSFVNAEVIQVAPIVIDKKTKNNTDETISILSNLKRAITQNKKLNRPSKDEEAKEILKVLKESIHVSSSSSSKKTKKAISRDIKHKKKITKKTIKKSSHKKKVHPKVKITKKDTKKSFNKKDKRSKVKITNKKIIKKRDKEVLLKKTEAPSSSSTEPIGFVKTLGVVGKSEVYEANDLAIDKREEIANDGVVDISTATTDELKGLPFVKPIEVIEVTQPFEASEAKKYQLDKR